MFLELLYKNRKFYKLLIKKKYIYIYAEIIFLLL